MEGAGKAAEPASQAPGSDYSSTVLSSKRSRTNLALRCCPVPARARSCPLSPISRSFLSDQTISRTHFGEYGFSVEFMFSLLGDPEEDLEKPDCSNNNFVACLFKKVAHANKVARKALGAGNKKVAGSGMGAGSLVTGVLDSMLHNTLQFSLTRNRYDTYDVVLDVVSWHTNPMFMSMIRMINGLPSDADIPANLFYLFAYKAKGFKTSTKTNEIQRELKLMFVDVPVESNNELSSSQQQQKAIGTWRGVKGVGCLKPWNRYPYCTPACTDKRLN